MTILQGIGILLCTIGLVFMAFGIYGIYSHKNFYTKITVASLIDSVGFLFVAFGVIVYQGFTSFSLKTLFLVVLVQLLNPLANHYITRGAHTSGYRPRKD